MNLDQWIGRVVLVAAPCGVQFADGRHLYLRVRHAWESKSWDGMAFLEGYVLDRTTGLATDRREVYVQVDGLQEVPTPAPVVRAARNAGPVRIPRPRTSPEPTTPTRRPR
jgi:hypothetical protein